MQRLIMSLALTIVLGGAVALAQSGGTSSYPKNSTVGSGVPPAPVGHRQPRAGDVPNEKNLSDPNNPVNKEDAALDRKIKSICRGC
ncbi:MAG: hypothetical protein WBF73_00475 [Bradyrhizobium sp.]